MRDDSVERAERAHYTAFAPALYGARSYPLSDGRATALHHAEIAEPVWNHAGMLRTAAADVDPLLSATVDFYARRQRLPVIGVDARPGSGELADGLKARGWQVQFRHAWLFATADLIAGALTAGVSIEEVTTPEGMERFLAVFTAAYDESDATYPAAAYRQAFLDSITGTGEMVKVEHYVLLVHGDPACCGSLAWSRGVAGLYNLGVHPAFRRRGLWTTITAGRMRRARAVGCEVVFLVTEDPAGEALYRRAGFELGLELRGFRAPSPP